MEEKVIKFQPNEKTYLNIAEKYSESGDYVTALGYLYEAKRLNEYSYEVLAAIADAYADLDLLELSNQFWIYYMDCAPKDKKSVAYEELAINYFYMNKLWASGYWFHQKLSKDGFINPEALDPEIVEYFTEEERKKESYKIVYPFDRADYSSLVKKSRTAFAEENLGAAIAFLEKVPEECRSAEDSSDLAFYYFLDKKDDKMLAECRSSLKRHGDNAPAYCNLATYYRETKDSDKALFYYEKAKSCCKDVQSEKLKLSSSAMDLGIHEDVEQIAQELLKDGRYDLSIGFMLAVAQINRGKYEEAEKSLCELLRLYPEDSIVPFYIRLCKRLKSGDKDSEVLLPLAYVRDLQDKTLDSYERVCRAFYSGKKVSEKRQELIKEVPLYCRDCSRASLVNCSYLPYAHKMREAAAKGSAIKKSDYKEFFAALLKSDMPITSKTMLIDTAVECGVKFRFGVSASGYYVSVKPAKTSFDKDLSKEGDTYRIAYAEAIEKLAFAGVEEEGKAGKVLSDIYSKYREDVLRMDLSELDLAAIAVASTDLFGTLGKKDICALFGAGYTRVIDFMENVMKFTSKEDEALLEKLLKKFKGMIENDTDA